ncbi:hypothetical protein QE152_g31147 [Popillia japonica]|uniref:Uncharacterized protein n=1 Tax=Popillia japonica TaxID=7064 RepID=A0AAW1JCE6_POPJA
MTGSIGHVEPSTFLYKIHYCCDRQITWMSHYCVCPQGADEDDGASVISLDPKRCAEWYVTASKADYQELAKLASDEPRFVKLKVSSFILLLRRF